MPMLCDRCGRPSRRVILQENGRDDWRGQLWCPACHGAEHNIADEAHAVHGDEIPGGMIVENYGPKPIVFYTHSAMREYRARHGLVLKESFCPFPGTDVDPQGVQREDAYWGEALFKEKAESYLRAHCVGYDKKPEHDVTGIFVNPVNYESDDPEEVRKYAGQ